MKKETWKAIPGYEGLYEVSDLGRVRSLGREFIDKMGRLRIFKSKILKSATSTQRRVSVVLYTSEGCKTYGVHNLVALAFIGERPDGYDTCHLDGDSTNNRLDNLRYDTRGQNQVDMYRQGSVGPRGKLTIEQILEIRKLYDTKQKKQCELAIIFGVHQTNISYIVRRLSYQWLNDDGTIDESKTEIKYAG